MICSEKTPAASHFRSKTEFSAMFHTFTNDIYCMMDGSYNMAILNKSNKVSSIFALMFGFGFFLKTLDFRTRINENMYFKNL